MLGTNLQAAVAISLFVGGTLPPESSQFQAAVLADKAIKPVELFGRYQHYDFSPLWLKTNNESVLGFIDSDYQRLRIKLLTIRPDTQRPGRYIVTGKSKVGETVLPIQGTFQLLHVREAAALPRGLDGAPVPAVKAGVVLLEYELKESSNQRNAGIFRGVARTNWYLDRKNKMQYNDINAYSDDFSNNQFVGTWQSYKTKRVKRCNWGDYRIPNGDALDQGAAEFSPVDKYVANGWQSYRKAWLENNTGAQKQEKATWWK